MTIWIAGEPGGKIANIMRNPKVALTIYEPVDHELEQKSVQVWGTAELINLKNNENEYLKRIEAFGLKEAAGGLMEKMAQKGQIPAGQEESILEKMFRRFNLIKVTPAKVVMLHMGPNNPPARKIWENGTATVKLSGF